MDDHTGTAVVPGAVTPWDVRCWALGPARPYRINTLYRLDGAVVTVTGRLGSLDAAADLTAALHVFEPLGAPLVLDLCHATLDDRAAAAVVDARRRRAAGTGMALHVRHASPVTRDRIARAEATVGGRPQPVRPVVATPWVK